MGDLTDCTPAGGRLVGAYWLRIWRSIAHWVMLPSGGLCGLYPQYVETAMRIQDTKHMSLTCEHRGLSDVASLVALRR